MEKKVTRRELLKNATGILGAIGALGLLSQLPKRASAAEAAVGKPVNENDAVVKALNYCSDADKATTCPTRKSPERKGQYCSSCQYYTEVKGTKMGKCQIIASGLVSSKGWCTSYMKNPKAKA